jgi:TonB family protein
VAPVLVNDVKPSYTAAAMAQRQQGRVLLAVTVNADGTVGKVRVTQHLSRELDAAAVKAARQWRFKPGTRNGKAVRVETAAEMTFTLR